MGVTYILLLSSLGFAIHTRAQDCLAPVAGDNMELQDNFKDLKTFENGLKVSFACNYGYRIKGGSSSIICTDGSWSLLRLTCEIKNCGFVDDVPNGDVDSSEGTEFGNKVVVTCKKGYNMIGKSNIFCGNEGWLQRWPVCQAVSCDPPSSSDPATFSPDKETYAFREVVRYTCPKEYTISDKSPLTCSENGTFQPNPPTCVMVQCKDPDIDNGKWVSGSRRPYRYQSFVTLECLSGYTMTGEPQQTCTMDSQWSPGLPTCEPIQCEDPKVLNSDRVDASQPLYKYKSTVTFKCKSGYHLKGVAKQTCEIGSQWSPGLPTCEKIPTTTTRPTTKKTIVDVRSTDSPDNHGHRNFKIGLGIGLTVFIGIVLTFCWWYCCGVPAIFKRKRGSRRGSAGDPHEEEVALA